MGNSALVDVSDFFSCSGRGKGESEAPGGEGGRLFIENPRKGGFSRRGGAEVPGACLWRIGEFGGGATLKTQTSIFNIWRFFPHYILRVKILKIF